MKKRLIAFVLAIVMLLLMDLPVFACNEKQTETYELQLLFGEEYSSFDSKQEFKMLMSALYLCSEQCDNQGQDKLDFLDRRHVRRLPELEELNIKNSDLAECSHNSWEYEYTPLSRIQNRRKKLLVKTVKTVFQFSFFDGLFHDGNQKADSFSAMLYYMHILSDLLADNPSASDASLESGNVNPFSGSASEEVNGNQPGFTPEQMKYADYSFYSELDYLHRCGMAFKVIGPDTLQTGDSKEDFGMNDPPGWSQKRYDDIIDVGYLYHRCHLIAHQLGGNEDQKNIMTGTSYLNETGMKPYEEKVANYVRKTGNHVLYRVTPFYKGENLIASGVQIEAYSIEDKGQGVCFNVYCYNVQPGVEINYNTGDNNRADTIYDDPHALPFAVYKADENNPDLILEMNKHLAILFEDHTSSRIYISMMDNIGTVAEKARNIGLKGEKPAQIYKARKECQYEYFNILKEHIPLLLRKENFFSKVFYKYR